ncbi:MAG: ATP-binding protein [Candidatus Moranbacteria bacterium]|nr:ATP-binding protein [Candidatus Moranbacteria bacterium]
MSFDIVVNNEFCYRIIQENADFLKLIYYSHIPTALIALFVSSFIFYKSGKIFSSRLLLLMSVLFSLWSVLDLVVWTVYDTRLTMFAWAPLGFLFMLIFALGLYFTYVFFDRKDISLKKKLVIFLPVLPVMVLTSTRWNLSGFDGLSCEAVEGVWLTNYYHLYGAFILLWIAVLAVSRYWKAHSHHKRMQILLFSAGIELFLISFFITGYIASLIDNFTIGIYGLFGMPIFMAFLGYLIVQFKAFNIRAFATQALVVTLILLIGSQFFFVKTHMNLILTAITFFLVVIAGVILIRSYKQSEEHKEELQVMADRLAISNDRLREMDNTKTEFISIASHQLRTPLTAIKGYCSLMLEGAYGTVTVPMEEAIRRIISSNNRLVNLVENLLNVSRMEAGRMEYEFEDYRVENILGELYESFSFTAALKNLTLRLELPEKPSPLLRVDKQKLQEVFSNLIDNAIKYTKKGSVIVTVEQNPENDKMRITVKDSGIGIPATEIPYLFTKFSRGKDIDRLHANGTGLGLYVAKNIVEAHEGKIWIESEGEGKGTSFIVELG